MLLVTECIALALCIERALTTQTDGHEHYQRQPKQRKYHTEFMLFYGAGTDDMSF